MSMMEGLVSWSLTACLTLLAGTAYAQQDPPGRVGRIADHSGSVWVFDDEQGQWAAALRNRPLTSGDRVSTGPESRAELRIGSTVWRLAPRTEFEVLRLDDERQEFELHSGSAAMRVRSREVADETLVRTAEARFKPQQAGHYRFDRFDDTTYAASLRGELLLDEAESFPIGAGQRMQFWRERGQRPYRWAVMATDEFASWIARDEQAEERSASTRYVSPEMTGAEDLDRYGRWDRHPEYGALWIPLSVQIGWAPYRFGHWVWLRPWGWTWVDAQPWGFAPFHYGRWVHWRGQWCWSPGAYVPRPVFAPALVAWIGGPHIGVSVSVGGRALPGGSWVPLAPREAYAPHFHASPRWADRVNHGADRPDRGHRGERSDPGGRRPPPRHVPTGPIMYGNQGVPGGVTPVSRDVLLPRPVATPAPHDGRATPPSPGTPREGRGREPVPHRGETSNMPRPVQPVPMEERVPPPHPQRPGLPRRAEPATPQPAPAAPIQTPPPLTAAPAAPPAAAPVPLPGARQRDRERDGERRRDRDESRDAPDARSGTPGSRHGQREREQLK